jgi:hypothetical protein
MDGGIRQRVEALRREIAQIEELSLAYLRKPGLHPTATADHERREQRLKAIMNELKYMTDWKKP